MWIKKNRIYSSPISIGSLGVVCLNEPHLQVSLVSVSHIN